jgi:hypothetical protein
MRSGVLFPAAAALLVLMAACGDDSTGPEQGEGGWQEITSQGITLRWRAEADSLELSMSAATTGWVGVGFDPTSQMEGANFLLGYVENGSVEMRDDWGTGSFSHASDTSLGGTSDLTVDGGTEDGGQTTLELTIPLDSGDQYDKPLTAGETYTVILASGADGADDFTSAHQVATSVSIEI